MINKEEVVHIAKLARLELSESEIEKMQKDLSAILDYFSLLKKAPKEEIILEKIKENAARKDEILQKRATLANDLILGAPDKKDGYIKVKAVL